MAPSSTGPEVPGRYGSPPLARWSWPTAAICSQKPEALADAVDRFRAGNGRIDIGTFQSVSSLILPAVVRRLLDEHPGCDIRLSEVEPEDPQIGDLDLLFHDGRIDGDVEHVKLLDEPYLLVAGAGAFPDGPVRVKLLDDAPMVAWPRTFHQRWLERALASAGAQPRIVFRTTGHETIVSMVRAGIGSAVLPWLALHGSDAWSDDQLSIHQLRAISDPRDVPALAGRTHPVATRDPSHRHRRRSRARSHQGGVGAVGPTDLVAARVPGQTGGASLKYSRRTRSSTAAPEFGVLASFRAGLGLTDALVWPSIMGHGRLLRTGRL